ncbi:hypothetical protein Tco_1411774, partial [Tanacetum coccineum]
VYEDEMKRSSSSTSTSQNLAFLSSENTSSTNEVSTAMEILGRQEGTWISKKNDLFHLINQKLSATTVIERALVRKCRSVRIREKNIMVFMAGSNCPTNEASSQALKVVKERDELKLKIEKWEESSKNLDELLNSQMSARDKTGLGYGTQLNEISNNSKTDSEISLSVFDVRFSDEESTPANDRSSKVDGYHAVPPPITENFLTPRADLSFAGLDEYAIRKKIIE